MSLSTFKPSLQERRTPRTILHRYLGSILRSNNNTTDHCCSPHFTLPSLLPPLFYLFIFFNLPHFFHASKREKLRALTGRLSQHRMNVRVVIIGRWRGRKGHAEKFFSKEFFSVSLLPPPRIFYLRQVISVGR